MKPRRNEEAQAHIRLSSHKKKMLPVRRADNLTTFMGQLSRNLGAATSWNPKGLSRPVMGLLYLNAYFILTLFNDVSTIEAVVREIKCLQHN
jgi:hypothetical protein